MNKLSVLIVAGGILLSGTTFAASYKIVNASPYSFTPNAGQLVGINGPIGTLGPTQSSGNINLITQYLSQGTIYGSLSAVPMSTGGTKNVLCMYSGPEGGPTNAAVYVVYANLDSTNNFPLTTKTCAQQNSITLCCVPSLSYY